MHWQHAWISNFSNVDPDCIIGQDGRSANYKGNVFFVARKDQEIFLRNSGFFTSLAIGLPYAYALANQPRPQLRIQGTLLVMPGGVGGHATPEESEKAFMQDADYIDFISELRHEFKRIQIVLYGRDIELGRGFSWEKAGFSILRGADHNDSLSLRRLVSLFSTSEFLTTNGLGSHVAYAAATGCRVSLAGPRPRIDHDRLATLTLYRNRPELLGQEIEINQILERDLEARGFRVLPVEAQSHLSWGKREIGYENLLPRDEVGPKIAKLTRFPYDKLRAGLWHFPALSIIFRRNSYRARTLGHS